MFLEQKKKETTPAEFGNNELSNAVWLTDKLQSIMTNPLLPFSASKYGIFNFPISKQCKSSGAKL